MALAESRVSVLFSEPKIPQFCIAIASLSVPNRFSALQRAENSSIYAVSVVSALSVMFQCSSASRKFLNCALSSSGSLILLSFSALQRAENSSITVIRPSRSTRQIRFSALQRAENSSILDVVDEFDHRLQVSVLFNEPKLLKSLCAARRASA